MVSSPYWSIVSTTSWWRNLLFPVTSSVLPWLRLNQNITGYGRQETVFSAHDTRRSCRSGYETTAPLRSLPNVDVVAPVHSAFTSTMYSVIRRQSARMLYARTVSTRVVDLWRLLHSYHCCMMTEANWRVSTNFHVFIHTPREDNLVRRYRALDRSHSSAVDLFIVHDLRVCHWQVKWPSICWTRVPGFECSQTRKPGLKNNPRVCIP